MNTSVEIKQAEFSDLKSKVMEKQMGINPDLEIKKEAPKMSLEMLFEKQLKMMEKEILKALPKHMDIGRLSRVTLSLVKGNQGLLKVFNDDPASLWASILLAAQMGLEPNTMGTCFIIPYYSNVDKKNHAQFQMGYRGYLKLLYNSNEIESAHVEVVYERDHLDIQFGIENKFIHKPYLDGDRGKSKIYYLIVKFKTGGHFIEFMTKDQIDLIRDRSKSKNNGPWVTDYDEMAKKTVVKRAAKYLPLSVEIQRAFSQDDVIKRTITDDLTEPQNNEDEAINIIHETIEG